MSKLVLILFFCFFLHWYECEVYVDDVVDVGVGIAIVECVGVDVEVLTTLI